MARSVCLQRPHVRLTSFRVISSTFIYSAYQLPQAGLVTLIRTGDTTGIAEGELVRGGAGAGILCRNIYPEPNARRRLQSSVSE